MKRIQEHYNRENTSKIFLENVLKNIEDYLETEYKIKMAEFNSADEKRKEEGFLHRIYGFYCKILSEKKTCEENVEILKIMALEKNDSQFVEGLLDNEFFTGDQLLETEYSVLLFNCSIKYYETKIEEVEEEFKA